MSEQYHIEVDYQNGFDQATVRITYTYDTEYVFPLAVIEIEQYVVLLDGSSIWVTVPDKNKTIEEIVFAMWQDEMIAEVSHKEEKGDQEMKGDQWVMELDQAQEAFQVDGDEETFTASMRALGFDMHEIMDEIAAAKGIEADTGTPWRPVSDLLHGLTGKRVPS